MKTAVFVPDAHSRPGIAAIRSLGRAGYVVHAGSVNINALGLKSKFASFTTVYPDFHDNSFISWIRSYISKHDIKMIVPTAGILFALKKNFSEFKHLLPVTDDELVLYGCFSKVEVFTKFKEADPKYELMKNHPVSTVVDLNRIVDERVLPPSSSGFFIKAERPLPCKSFASFDFAYAKDKDLAITYLKEMSNQWALALVQEACDGYQVGVSVLMDNGSALAVSCVRDCYLYPHSKGTMSLRKSSWFPDIINDAVKRLAFLKWQGCAMCEYRYDESNNIYNLIEINFRFWQYLHLDLWAGMDYPRMQAEWFLYKKRNFNVQPVIGVVCRDTWPGEVSHLVNEIRRNKSNIVKLIFEFLLFFLRFFNPRIHQDFYFPGDRCLYWHNFSGYIKDEYYKHLKNKYLP